MKKIHKNASSTSNSSTGSGSASGGIQSENTDSASVSIDPTPSKPSPKAPPKTKQPKAKSQSPTVVIPYKASMAKADELRYAIRAWDKHLPGCAIVIIGDKPKWLGKEATVIPISPKDKNPQVDVAHKMAQAIAAEEVPDYFFWSNDDIYPVCHLTISDIDVLKAHGRLKQKGARGGIYRQNSERTVTALKKIGITKPWDFATHTPVAFRKNELAEVLAKFNCLKEGHLISSLYFNTVFRSHRPIITPNGANGSIVASVFRSNPDKKILDKAFSNRKFINNNDAGWKSVLPYLQKLFPKKSRFEK